MNSLIRRTAAAVAAVLVVGTLSACEAYDLPVPGSPVSEGDSFEITAEFNDVLNLVPRSPVKVNDVTVGEVIELDRVGWHARAVLRIKDDVTLPANTVASIRQTSLLGEKYVALEPGPGEAAGELEDGAVLALESTGRNPELEEILGSLAFLLNGGGVGQLRTITEEINLVFSGREDRIRSVLSRLRVLVEGLDEQKGDIIAAMEALNRFSGTLNRERDTVTAALDNIGPAVGILADQRQDLIRMLRSLDRLGKVGTRVVNASKDDLIATLRNLQPVLREIARTGDELPTALSLLISYPFPIESNNIVHGDYANTENYFSINLNNVLSALGGREQVDRINRLARQGRLDLSDGSSLLDEIQGLQGGLVPEGAAPDAAPGGSADDLGGLLGGGTR